MTPDQMHVRIFGDGADINGIVELARLPWIRGFTTNPTLMRKAGVTDYQGFAREVLRAVPDRPISFGVLSDEFDEMEAQALEIASWGANVNVKIPVTNTAGVFAGPLIRRLSRAGVALNVTAVLTPGQVKQIVDCMDVVVPSFVSVFAGRIADTGRDPLPIMEESLHILRARPQVQLIWASPRELLNVMQADAIGCDVITVTNDILKKLTGLGKDLDEFSLETVRMFHDDSVRAGYRIDCATAV